MKKLSFGKVIGIAICMAIICVGLLNASNVNDVDTKREFLALQSQAQVALAMTAYHQYIDASVAGTTITYSRYKSDSGTIFISKASIIVAGDITQKYNEYARNTWSNRDSATYMPINE